MAAGAASPGCTAQKLQVAALQSVQMPKDKPQHKSHQQRPEEQLESLQALERLQCLRDARRCLPPEQLQPVAPSGQPLGEHPQRVRQGARRHPILT